MALRTAYPQAVEGEGSDGSVRASHEDEEAFRADRCNADRRQQRRAHATQRGKKVDAPADRNRLSLRREVVDVGYAVAVARQRERAAGGEQNDREARHLAAKEQERENRSHAHDDGCIHDHRAAIDLVRDITYRPLQHGAADDEREHHHRYLGDRHARFVAEVSSHGKEGGVRAGDHRNRHRPEGRDAIERAHAEANRSRNLRRRTHAHHHRNDRAR